MTQIIIQRDNDLMPVYCYDSETDANEVNETLHQIVKKYGMTKNIWVVSGTHGMNTGEVTVDCKAVDFKYEDLDSARVTSKNIHIKNYHQLCDNTWRELREKPGATNILVLAFCYSQQWFNNSSAQGNNGKL